MFVASAVAGEDQIVKYCLTLEKKNHCSKNNKILGERCNYEIFVQIQSIVRY